MTTEFFDIENIENAIYCFIKDETKRQEIREEKTEYRNKNKLLSCNSDFIKKNVNN
jgi:hypothetical protein